jgi:hypothetical protein
MCGDEARVVGSLGKGLGGSPLVAWVSLVPSVPLLKGPKGRKGPKGPRNTLSSAIPTTRPYPSNQSHVE